MSGSMATNARSTRRRLTVALVLIATAWTSSIANAQTDYTYTGAPFTTADPPYTTGDRIQGAFSTAVPLPPFVTSSFIDVLDYSFSDGVVTLTPANSIVCRFDVTTDGAGHIQEWLVTLRELVNNPGDPQQLIDSSHLGDQAGVAPADANPCAMLIPTLFASNEIPGAWSDDFPPGTLTTYSYTGDSFVNADPPYTTMDRVSGSFEVVGSLPPLFPMTDIGSVLETFSFTDGVQTRTPANSVVCQFEVATDPAGKIVAWFMVLRERGVMAGDPQQVMDLFTESDSVGSAPAGTGPCDMIFPTITATSDSGGTWTDPLPPGVPITYSYTGERFNIAAPPYTTDDRVLGSIDLASALPPFVADRDIGFALENFSFTDGVQTRTPANSVVCRFRVSTDGEGNIIQWLVGLRQIGVNPGDPQQTIDSSAAGDVVGTGPADANPCGQIALSTAAEAQTGGTWGAPLPPAEPVAYTYEGDPVTFAEPPYSIGDRLLGSISVAGRLPPSLPLVDITPSLLDLVFDDGQQVRTLGDTVICAFRVGTDAQGEIVQWQVNLREAGVPQGSTQHAADTFNLGSFGGDLFGTDAASTDPCGNLTLSPRGNVETPGTWIGETPSGPAEIPTLSEVAAALLATLLAFAALTILRQRG